MIQTVEGWQWKPELELQVGLLMVLLPRGTPMKEYSSPAVRRRWWRRKRKNMSRNAASSWLRHRRRRRHLFSPERDLSSLPDG